MLLSEDSRLKRLTAVVWIAVMLLIARVTIGVLFGYVNYFPPNFYSEFLTGRRDYFFGIYQVAFWVHIIFSPLVMFSGMWLMTSRMRRSYPKLHRQVGRIHVWIVLTCVAPSGLWMSFYAATGAWAGIAFGLSSLATFYCAFMGWRSAVARRFHIHQQWMTRCFLLLCSAIVLRLLSGTATVLQSDQLWTYPMFAWISTLAPLLIYETVRANPIRSS